MPRKPVGLRFNPLDLERWQAQARLEDRSLTELVERAMEQYCQRAEMSRGQNVQRRKIAQ